jgi:hypothetical protein
MNVNHIHQPWGLESNNISNNFLVLMLEVEHVVDGKLESLYKGIYQGDEAIVLV